MTASQITEKTLVPVSLVVVLLGFAGWVSGVSIQGRANALEITEIKTTRAKQVESEQKFREKVLEDLGDIKGRLEAMSRGRPYAREKD